MLRPMMVDPLKLPSLAANISVDETEDDYEDVADELEPAAEDTLETRR